MMMSFLYTNPSYIASLGVLWSKMEENSSSELEKPEPICFFFCLVAADATSPVCVKCAFASVFPVLNFPLS